MNRFLIVFLAMVTLSGCVAYPHRGGIGYSYPSARIYQPPPPPYYYGRGRRNGYYGGYYGRPWYPPVFRPPVYRHPGLGPVFPYSEHHLHGKYGGNRGYGGGGWYGGDHSHHRHEW